MNTISNFVWARTPILSCFLIFASYILICFSGAVAIDKHIEILPKAILTGIPIPVHKAASPPPPVITVAVINI